VIIINNGRIAADDSIQHLQQVNTRQDVLVITLEQEVKSALLDQLKHAQRYEYIESNKWKLITDAPDSLRREVMQWALNNDLSISSMQAQTETLEDVFRTLTKK
jgi:ABC-2 type transport system ATP-binding protein